ncbi:amidohydrolase family protein [Aeromicrobium ponti]|uniref:Putative TIM-barrel fold metal-dependent hydrolase n=1 Tax=Cytobacillus oceanisediminis TaxID=665099 RepID=A0A562JSL7_9BACI|nr:amidohydrolase family protein [Cytobacillus oceanisediminis]TWH85914.1 putative TIM-barrel fold metal-dependent hydrolase [Cytobacillus oceanisediminis]
MEANKVNKIIDADVHPWINGDIKGLLPYLSKSMQKVFDGRLTLPDHPLRPPLEKSTSIRLDATPPGGGAGGSDPIYMREVLLNRYNIEHAILTSVQAGKIVVYPNPIEATALARAFNDYFLNEWLTLDSRYKLAMCIAVHDPLKAAEEIRRIGHERGVVAVFMPLFNILMGNSYYYPIYEAAEELGLPILIHPTGTEGGFSTSVSMAGGVPSSYIERHTDFPQIAYGNLVSMVFEGVFVRFPKLKVLAAEFGYSWVPSVMWRMDQNWRNFRKEVPWLEKEPSKYLLDHVRFTSQPVEEPEKGKYLMQIFEMMHAEKTLIFSTDYPHWDNDFPDNTFTTLPEPVKQRIFYDNAAELFNLNKLEITR